MTLLVHVNEVSVCSVPTQEASDEVASKFAAVLREVRRRRGDSALVSSIALRDVVLYQHHTLGEWGRRDANRDLWRLVRRMQDKSPGQRADANDDVCEYKIGDVSVWALGEAHMSDGLLLSFATSAHWSNDSVAGQRQYLQEIAGGQIQIQIEDVDVRHASTESHLETHLDWMTQAGIDQFMSGADLLADCEEMFTQIKLLDRARGQLRKLDAKWVTPVARELALMNRALLEWRPDVSFPAWYTKVSPESQSRIDKGLVDFVDLDGVVRSFSTHARLTPGEGRIHFRAVKTSRSATVAHIGAKIL